MPLLIRTTGLDDYLDAQGEANIKALILGEPSAGKTRSASFWPRPIFADCEGGRMSIADRKVPFARIWKSADMDALLTKLEVECKTRPAPDRRYQTLVIDTIDAYQRIVIQEILRANNKESMSGWSDWGQLDAKMTNLVARLNAIPMNVVVNCHVKASKDGGDDGPLVKEPKLKGDLRDQIAAEFDVVGYMSTFWEAENGERVLKRAVKWMPEPAFPILKDRSGQLPRFTPVDFTEGDYGRLFEAIYTGAHIDELTESEAVEELDEGGESTPEPPREGGPVRKPAKKAAAPESAPAPAAAAPASAPASAPAATGKARARNVPAAKTAAAVDDTTTATPVEDPPEPPPAHDEPDPAVAEGDSAPDMEQATATVAAELGGTVVSDSADADASSTPPPTAPAEPDANALPCGTPAKNTTDPVPGCGRDLNQMKDAGDLINIALIKTKTYLCPDCLQAFRAGTKK